MKNYLEVFFEEKGLPFATFEVEHEGMVHFIESDFVICTILTANDKEKKQIGDIIRKIDFQNGDVMHFLRHLAEGYVKTNY